MRECSRCRRPAPPSDSAEFAAWHLGPSDAELICPGCLTRGESTAGDDDLTIALMEIDVKGQDGPHADGEDDDGKS